MVFDKGEYLNFILDKGCVRTFDEERPVNSRRQSRWFVDTKKLLSNTRFLNDLSDFFLDFAGEEGINAQHLHGVSESAIMLDKVIQYKNSKKRIDSIFLGDKSTGQACLETDVNKLVNQYKKDPYLGFMGHPSSDYGKTLGIIAQYMKNNELLDDTNIAVFRKVPIDNEDPKESLAEGYPKNKIILLKDENTVENGYDFSSYFNIVDEIELKDFASYLKGKEIGLIEDVVSSSLSSFEQVYKMSEKGHKVSSLTALVNREESTPIPGYDDDKVVERFRGLYEGLTGKAYEPKKVDKIFEDIGVEFNYMVGASDIVTALDKGLRNRINEENRESMEYQH